MQIKEKAKSKTKTNNSNKLPLPKIRYSIPKNQPLIKTNQTNNQPLLNVPNNKGIAQYNLIQPNIYQTKEQKQKEEHKFHNKTNIRIKSLYEQKNGYKLNATKNNENKNNISQYNLKYLLKEFGLSEYFRKLCELGYDNNNYLKIGGLSRRNFNSLLNSINIFPGHNVKMEKFYEYLKKFNNNSNSTTYRKRKLNYNSIYGLNNYNNYNGNNTKPNPNHIKYNHYYDYDIYNINKQSLNSNNSKNNQKNKKSLSPKIRPKTSHMNGLSKPKIRIRNNYSGNKIMKKGMEEYHKSPFLDKSSENNKNCMIKSYLNDHHKFLDNHKLNYNKNLLELQKKYNDVEFNSHLNNNSNSNESNGKKKYNILYNSYNNTADKQRELEDKINENIERMLNYYMIQLNDKLDRSYETVEDSSLSYIITSQMSETPSNGKQNEKNNGKNCPNYKLPSLNNNKKKENNINNNNLKAKNSKNSDNMKKTDKDNVNDIKKENEKGNNNNIEEKKNSNNINVEKIEEMILNKSKEETKEMIEEELKKEINKFKEEYYNKDNIKKISEHENSTKSKDSKEQQQEEIEEDEFLAKDKKQVELIKVQNPLNSKEKEKEGIKNDILNEQQKLLDDSYFLSQKYSLEQNIYDTLRLNRSMDLDNINKDSLKFDIEFMCRCLGLALMRHIEQGKEKQHITELYNEQNQKIDFTFFNSDFNDNISLIKDFFNNKNNEAKLGDLNMISILESFYLKNSELDNDNIDLMKHIKKAGDEKFIQKENLSEETFKLKSGLVDIDNEIKFIGEFFSYGKKKLKNYQNLSENTKKILCKDLSYIKEIDSELNKTGSVLNNTEKENSHCSISKSNNDSKVNEIAENSENNVSKTDSKNNRENKTKIIGGEEKDEEYNNYEDEFINDNNENKNIADNNNKTGEKTNTEKEDELNKEESINDNKDESNTNDDTNVKKENKNKDILDNLKDKFEKKEITEEIKEPEIEDNKLNVDINLNKVSQGIDTNEVNKKLDIFPAVFKPISNIEKNSFFNGAMKQDNENVIETDYIIDVDNIFGLKEYLLKQFEIFDDDFLYYSMNIPAKKFMAPPDPQSIFEFCANIMILTKMEKEVIIISLIYIERLIFNTGFVLNSRNWRKIIFIALIIASKIWDDDSLENIHYSQVFTHLKIGEINLLERTFLELINYKVFVKFSEYIKYYLWVKNLALRYNFNGEQIVPVSVEKMMKIQEYAYQMQKRMRRKISLNNSAHF